jgi:hypothetical protein
MAHDGLVEFVLDAIETLYDYVFIRGREFLKSRAGILLISLIGIAIVVYIWISIRGH